MCTCWSSHMNVMYASKPIVWRDSPLWFWVLHLTLRDLECNATAELSLEPLAYVTPLCYVMTTKPHSASLHSAITLLHPNKPNNPISAVNKNPMFYFWFVKWSLIQTAMGKFCCILLNNLAHWIAIPFQKTWVDKFSIITLHFFQEWNY